MNVKGAAENTQRRGRYRGVSINVLFTSAVTPLD